MHRATAAFLLFAATSAFAADYGDPLPADAAPVSIATALADADAHADAPRAFSGRVGKICQTKGCWMMLTEGDAMVRVMTGHRYFLPKDASGDAVVYGTLKRKEMSAEQAAHMAKDGGEPAPADGQGAVEWRIDATSIRIEPAG
ncbi:MAG: DUF4920 domain-containing protein [Xanthomonadaceae bacterium]|jgi:hypothetical protein|nr:DUF4920 domain-containing protein [Xanthomonadaceae bacterium]